jgi:hypothetical protein
MGRMAKSRHGPDQFLHSGFNIQLRSVLGLMPQKGKNLLIRGFLRHVGLSGGRHSLTQGRNRGDNLLTEEKGWGNGPCSLGNRLEVLLGVGPPHELELKESKPK